MINETHRTELSGGRKGQIFKQGNLVTRPLNPWTKTIHAYLNHLHHQGLAFVPLPHNIDEASATEQVSYIEGEVCSSLINDAFLSETALISAAKLLRQLHDASVGFLSQLKGDEVWMLPCLSPAEVICHADYAPYNAVAKDNQVVGIIDFDTCHPGTRVWDVAYAIYRWAPLSRPGADGVSGSTQQHIARANQFCDAYGLTNQQRAEIAPIMVERLRKMINYIVKQAKNGNQTFIANMDDGHHIHYQKDINFLTKNMSMITQGLAL